jgi:hypothetical protein
MTVKIENSLSYMAKICSRLADGTGGMLASISFRNAGFAPYGWAWNFGSRIGRRRPEANYKGFAEGAEILNKIRPRRAVKGLSFPGR